MAFDVYAMEQYPSAFEPDGVGDKFIQSLGAGIGLGDVIAVVRSVRGAAKRNLKCWDEDYSAQGAADPAPRRPAAWEEEPPPSPNALSVSKETEGTMEGRGVTAAFGRQARPGRSTERGDLLASMIRVYLPPASRTDKGPRQSMLKRICLGVVGRSAEVRPISIIVEDIRVPPHSSNIPEVIPCHSSQSFLRLACPSYVSFVRTHTTRSSRSSTVLRKPR
jgi:hypothetical protein